MLPLSALPEADAHLLRIVLLDEHGQDEAAQREDGHAAAARERGEASQHRHHHQGKGAWVPSRAETLDSGLPPSPHLMHLIRK